LAEAKDLSPKGFRTVVDIDLVGSFHVLRAGFEHLRKPGAAVLNISALQSFMPTWQQVHAGAAKAGIDMMMRTMALEWGQYGVRVNSIAPGPVAGTEGMARLSPDDETSAAITRAIPLGRWADTDDVADLAIFLCSDAARNITGTLMVSDGGYSLNGRVLHA
jgi:NAD(P)-dependent dehydrogenase (short-subunit alcohol dehydrogenase family)